MRNRSFFFIMPLLGFPADFPQLAGFINTYVRHGDYPFLTNHLFILCDREKLRNNGLVTHQLTHHDMYVDSHIIEEHELLVFALPEDYRKDLKSFIKGKYSMLSKKAKDKIFKIFLPTISGKVTKNFAVLNPTDPKAKIFKKELEQSIGQSLTGKFELISIPDVEKETYKLSDHFELFEDLKEIQHLQLM